MFFNFFNFFSCYYIRIRFYNPRLADHFFSAHLVRRIRSLMIARSAITNTAHSTAALTDISAMSKISYRKQSHSINPAAHSPKIAKWIFVNGLEILHRFMKPTAHSRYTLAVLTSLDEISNRSANRTIAAMEKKDVNAAGIAPVSVLWMNRPSCLRIFGSSASRNAGKPMLNTEIRETCVGCSGYVKVPMIEKIARRNENRCIAGK